jgi:Arc/MetJ-type ribon-helix-helix transcriptional regulator
MRTTFPLELEQFIEHELAAGHFASRDALIVAAIRLLMQRQADLAHLKAASPGAEGGHSTAGQPMFTFFACTSEKVENVESRSRDQFPPGLRGTLRGSPFEKGHRYRVIAEAPGWNDSLNVGEVITYERSTWSRYDEATIYIFRSNENKERTWILRDDDSLESWRRVFEPVRD